MDGMKKLVRDAEIFAIAAHGNQQYGFHPYYKHLKDVVRICEHYGSYAQVLAWLHDVLEDTACKTEQLVQVFGTEVAYDCQLLSDPPGVDRKTRKMLLNIRLADPETPRMVLVVKAADRLANVRHSMLGNSSMLEKYRSEHQQFSNACKRAQLAEPIWEELDQRIYGVYKEF